MITYHCIARQTKVGRTPLAKPFDEFLNARFNLSLGIIAEQLSCFGYIREGLRHIAWLWRLPINLRAPAERVFQECN